MHRFFVTDRPLAMGAEVDLAPIARQLRQVLRMQPGDHILLLDNAGHAFDTEILLCTPRAVRGAIVAGQPAGGEPSAQLTLYPCSLKADRFEWMLQKGVELGVARFVPVISERTIARPATALLKRYPRWQAIVREAAEQCQRGAIPSLDPPLALPDAVRAATGQRLLPWEASAGPGPAAAMAAQLEPAASISLLIGPEGGLTYGEVTLAQEHGWTLVSLGARILRAETAALAATAIVMAQLGELGDVGTPTARPF